MASNIEKFISLASGIKKDMDSGIKKVVRLLKSFLFFIIESAVFIISAILTLLVLLILMSVFGK